MLRAQWVAPFSAVMLSALFLLTVLWVANVLADPRPVLGRDALTAWTVGTWVLGLVVGPWAVIELIRRHPVGRELGLVVCGNAAAYIGAGVLRLGGGWRPTMLAAALLATCAFLSLTSEGWVMRTVDKSGSAGPSSASRDRIGARPAKGGPEELGPGVLARIAKRTGLKPEDL